MTSIMITLLLLVFISIIGPLEDIYDFFQFLYTNFSFPLLILVVVIVFKKELKNLLNRISKITYGDHSVELGLVEIKKNLNSTVNQYSNVKIKELPPMGGGGGGIPSEDTEIPAFTVLYNDSMLENYLKKSGSVATIQKLYKAYEKSLMNHYNLNFADINSIKEKIRKYGDQNELDLFNEIVEFYTGVTYFESNKKYEDELLNRNDIQNYRRLIKVAISEFYFENTFK